MCMNHRDGATRAPLQLKQVCRCANKCATVSACSRSAATNKWHWARQAFQAARVSGFTELGCLLSCMNDDARGALAVSAGARCATSTQFDFALSATKCSRTLGHRSHFLTQG